MTKDVEVGDNLSSAFWMICFFLKLGWDQNRDSHRVLASKKSASK